MTKYCEVCNLDKPEEGFERQWGEGKEIDICEECIGKTRYQRDVCRTHNLHGNMYKITRPHKPTQRVHRNRPCPCGSGKKLKKCCIRKYVNG